MLINTILNWTYYNLGNSIAMKYFCDYYSNNKILIYYELNKIINKPQIVIEKINELKKDKNICKFINKINYSLNKNLIDTCPICLNDNVNILFLDCMHFRCIDCFSYYNVCKICD